MSTTRPAARSPLAFARSAREVARAALPAYSSRSSRRDFTQPQLVARPAVRQFLRTDYRGRAAHLADGSDLRAAPGLTEVPHLTTAQEAPTRPEKKTPTPS